jgi:hypothetical protein
MHTYVRTYIHTCMNDLQCVYSRQLPKHLGLYAVDFVDGEIPAARRVYVCMYIHVCIYVSCIHLDQTKYVRMYICMYVCILHTFRSD